MTQTASLRRYSLYVALGLVLMGLGLMLAVGQREVRAENARPAGVTMHRIDAIPPVHAGGTDVSGTLDRQAQLLASVGGGELSPAQAARLEQAAHLVCEGFTADVPLTVMEQALAAREGLSPVQAHDFVQAALRVVCKAY